MTAPRPSYARRRRSLGRACFTMSLFIGSLAFERTLQDLEFVFDERLGIILGSLLSGIVGYVVLHLSLPKEAK